MLDLSLSFDLAHPFPKGLTGKCDTQLSPTTPAWQFAIIPLGEAVGVQIGRASTGTCAPGSVNKPGNYHCGHRIYDPGAQGRWTVPDPAMTPWSHLFDYVSCSPVSALDPSGLGQYAPYSHNYGGLSVDFPAGGVLDAGGEGFDYAWDFDLGRLHGQGYRVIQRVWSRTIFRCCEGNEVTIEFRYLEMFANKSGTDHQEDHLIATRGHAHCANSGGLDYFIAIRDNWVAAAKPGPTSIAIHAGQYPATVAGSTSFVSTYTGVTSSGFSGSVQVQTPSGSQPIQSAAAGTSASAQVQMPANPSKGFVGATSYLGLIQSGSALNSTYFEWRYTYWANFDCTSQNLPRPFLSHDDSVYIYK